MVPDRSLEIAPEQKRDESVDLRVQNGVRLRKSVSSRLM